MAFDYGVLSGGPSVDPKVVDRISRSSRMMAEQGPGFMQSWGGSSSLYGTLARLPKNERLVYAAALEGHATSVDIQGVTGLKSAEVSVALTSLGEQGLVTSPIEL